MRPAEAHWGWGRGLVRGQLHRAAVSLLPRRRIEPCLHSRLRSRPASLAYIPEARTPIGPEEPESADDLHGWGHRADSDRRPRHPGRAPGPLTGGCRWVG